MDPTRSPPRGPCPDARLPLAAASPPTPNYAAGIATRISLATPPKTWMATASAPSSIAPAHPARRARRVPPDPPDPKGSRARLVPRDRLDPPAPPGLPAPPEPLRSSRPLPPVPAPPTPRPTAPPINSSSPAAVPAPSPICPARDVSLPAPPQATAGPFPVTPARRRPSRSAPRDSKEGEPRETLPLAPDPLRRRLVRPGHHWRLPAPRLRHLQPRAQPVDRLVWLHQRQLQRSHRTHGRRKLLHSRPARTRTADHL